MIYTSLDSALDALSNGVLHICLANQIAKHTGWLPPSGCVLQKSVRIARVNINLVELFNDINIENLKSNSSNIRIRSTDIAVTQQARDK
jgi:hypothetical protein